jgi:hypothetical protein
MWPCQSWGVSSLPIVRPQFAHTAMRAFYHPRTKKPPGGGNLKFRPDIFDFRESRQFSDIKIGETPKWHTSNHSRLRFMTNGDR